MNAFRLSVCLALTCVLFAGEPAGAENSDPFVMFQNRTNSQSDNCYEQVERGLATIPKNIRDAMLSAGYSLIIAPTLLSAVPQNAGLTPRGWREDSTYDNAGGIFQTRALRIVIAETIEQRKNPGRYVPSPHVELTVRHEYGHAFDHFSGKISLSPEFVDDYTADAARLTPAQEQRFHYFLQPNGAGNAELFASLFAAAYTPNAPQFPRYGPLMEAFPKTTAFILRLSPNKARWNEPAAKAQSR